MTWLPPTTDGHPARRGVVPPPENPRTPASISANDLLVVPKNPISGGDAIPVSFRITSDWLKKNVKAPRSTTPGKPVQLSAAAVDLKWNDTLIATFTLGKSAREITGLSKDIQFATRLKIKTEQNKTTTGALTATAKLIPAGESELPPVNAHANFEVKYSDCCAAKINQLFLSVQPSLPKGQEIVAVKSFIPTTISASRRLTTVECALNSSGGDLAPSGANASPGELPDYVLMRVDINAAGHQYLADEVFLGFNFLPQEPGLLTIFWRYDDEPKNLSASAYLPLISSS